MLCVLAVPADAPLSPFLTSAAHQEGGEYASVSLGFFCFAFVVVYSPVERAGYREVTLLLTTLVALWVSVT